MLTYEISNAHDEFAIAQKSMCVLLHTKVGPY